MMRNGSIIIPKGRDLSPLHTAICRIKERKYQRKYHMVWVGSIPKGREISSSSSNFTKQARKKQTEKESQDWVCSNKDKTESHIH
jgi:hypothetical protein